MVPRCLIITLASCLLAIGCGKKKENPPPAKPAANTNAAQAPPAKQPQPATPTPATPAVKQPAPVKAPVVAKPATPPPAVQPIAPTALTALHYTELTVLKGCLAKSKLTPPQQRAILTAQMSRMKATDATYAAAAKQFGADAAVAKMIAARLGETCEREIAAAQGKTIAGVNDPKVEKKVAVHPKPPAPAPVVRPLRDRYADAATVRACLKTSKTHDAATRTAAFMKVLASLKLTDAQLKEADAKFKADAKIKVAIAERTEAASCARELSQLK